MAKIKAVIFDLDDTLYDCTGKLVEPARRKTAAEVIAPTIGEAQRDALRRRRQTEPMAARLEEILAQEGGACTPEAAYRMQLALEQEHGPYFLVFDELARLFGLDASFADRCYQVYQSAPVEEIEPFPDLFEVLTQLHQRGYYRFLVSAGSPARQMEKIKRLGLCAAEGSAHGFDRIRLAGMRLPQLEQHFMALLKEFNLQPDEVLCVGDRLREEIRVANEMGMLTAQMVRGRFHRVAPRVPAEQPDYVIHHLSQVPTLLHLREIGKPPEELNVVALGGGTGLPVVLQGLKTYARNLTAVVAVTDTGGHSGALLEPCGPGMLPPGDVRNVLVALAGSEPEQERLAQLFDYRFHFAEAGPEGLAGASLGNLLLTALFNLNGRSFQRAIEAAGELLKVTGKVLPVTEDEVDICAVTENGTRLANEVAILENQAGPLREVYLEPRRGNLVRPNPAALEALRHADLIVLGPGALYTSVVANLLVPGIATAVRESAAKKVYVGNIVTQPGQTDSFTASQHVDVILRHLREGVPQPIHQFSALVNRAQPDDAATRKLLEQECKEIVLVDAEELDKRGIYWAAADLIGDLRDVPWEGPKAGMLRHDPHRLGDAICREYARMVEEANRRGFRG